MFQNMFNQKSKIFAINCYDYDSRRNLYFNGNRWVGEQKRANINERTERYFSGGYRCGNKIFRNEISISNSPRSLWMGILVWMDTMFCWPNRLIYHMFYRKWWHQMSKYYSRNEIFDSKLNDVEIKWRLVCCIFCITKNLIYFVKLCQTLWCHWCVCALTPWLEHTQARKFLVHLRFKFCQKSDLFRLWSTFQTL